ncbi:MAG TPA: rRNA maturation RNase YbeY [Gammaproteobacteria bacterium]|nr:rRNA maturation RNase YbeY [Gammaproteobacteria bacterium]
MLHWVEAALETENHGVELVIRLVDEAESAELNEAYRGKTGPTNVLSFPFDMPPEVEETRLLGDLVICAPVVRREAAEQGKTEPAHWAHLVVHGTLHLQGYDHQSEAGAAEMEGLERQILARLGYPDPYHEEADPA